MSDRASNAASLREGESEISWKLPVIAAIVGALLVGVFVIYAVVAGPVDEPETDAVQSTDLPPGFVALSSGTGIKFESMTETEGSILVVASSAVPGSVDPDDVAPAEMARWELETDAGVVLMDGQYATNTAAGNTTVVFSGGKVSGEPHLVAYPATESTHRITTLEVTADSLGEGTEFAIDMGEGAVITGEVTAADGWGFVEWSTGGPMTAKVDVVVTFMGTDDPSTESIEEARLIPGHLAASPDDTGPVQAVPLFGYRGRYQLYPSGASASAGMDPTAIVMEIQSTAVTKVGEPVLVKFRADS
jgi:hypothetical protein